MSSRGTPRAATAARMALFIVALSPPASLGVRARVSTDTITLARSAVTLRVPSPTAAISGPRGPDVGTSWPPAGLVAASATTSAMQTDRRGIGSPPDDDGADGRTLPGMGRALRGRRPETGRVARRMVRGNGPV